MQTLTDLRTLQSCQRRCISMVLSGNADKAAQNKVSSSRLQLQHCGTYLPLQQTTARKVSRLHLWVASTQNQGLNA